MAKKRKEVIDLEISNINDEPRIFVERNEIMKLTEVAKSWEFTCSFCFKKFPSAQAMGGHQNAHRSERLEEKRLFVRDPIGYRKRAYLRAMKAMNSSAEYSGSGINLHATSKMVKHDLTNIINGPPKNLKRPAFSSGDFNNGKDSLAALDISGENNLKKMLVMNFLPPKELSLADNVGIHADVKGKAKAAEFDNGSGYDGINFEKLDLTLKL